jgi:HEAT repeat protein
VKRYLLEVAAMRLQRSRSGILLTGTVVMDRDETQLQLLSADALFTLVLTSEDEAQAWSAIAQLHRLTTEAVFTEAVRLCHGHEARQRRVGVDVLAQLGLPEHTFHESVMQVLLARLEIEDSPDVLASIGVALGHRGDVRAIEPLLALQQHPDPDVRAGVVFGMYQRRCRIGSLGLLVTKHVAWGLLNCHHFICWSW